MVTSNALKEVGELQKVREGVEIMTAQDRNEEERAKLSKCERILRDNFKALGIEHSSDAEALWQPPPSAITRIGELAGPPRQQAGYSHQDLFAALDSKGKSLAKCRDEITRLEFRLHKTQKQAEQLGSAQQDALLQQTQDNIAQQQTQDDIAYTSPSAELAAARSKIEALEDDLAKAKGQAWGEKTLVDQKELETLRNDNKRLENEKKVLENNKKVLEDMIEDKTKQIAFRDGKLDDWETSRELTEDERNEELRVIQEQMRSSVEEDFKRQLKDDIDSLRQDSSSLLKHFLYEAMTGARCVAFDDLQKVGFMERLGFRESETIDPYPPHGPCYHYVDGWLEPSAHLKTPTLSWLCHIAERSGAPHEWLEMELDAAAGSIPTIRTMLGVQAYVLDQAPPDRRWLLLANRYLSNALSFTKNANIQALALSLLAQSYRNSASTIVLDTARSFIKQHFTAQSSSLGLLVQMSVLRLISALDAAGVENAKALLALPELQGEFHGQRIRQVLASIEGKMGWSVPELAYSIFSDVFPIPDPAEAYDPQSAVQDPRLDLWYFRINQAEPRPRSASSLIVQREAGQETIFVSSDKKSLLCIGKPQFKVKPLANDHGAYSTFIVLPGAEEEFGPLEELDARISAYFKYYFYFAETRQSIDPIRLKATTVEVDSELLNELHNIGLYLPGEEQAT